MYKKDFERINEMMHQKGVFIDTDCGTGKEYYTGYEYATLYDWDQYFESIVQLYLGWESTYARNGVEIFLELQKESGHIQRSSKGVDIQISENVKPFLAQIALLIYNRDGNLDFLKANDFRLYERMKKYVIYWLENPDNYKGLAYWDSALHTGMDNQHERAGTWVGFKGQQGSDYFCCGVDLNCYLVRESKAFSLIAEIFGKADDAAYFHAHSERLKKTILEMMWDEEDRFFYDIDKRTGEKIRVRYIGAFAALWADVVDGDKAKDMLEKYLFNPNEFKRPFPYPVLSYSEPGYSEEFLPTDIPGCCNWRANTWIPTNYYVFQGLRKYGYMDAAKELAQITYDNVKRIGDREYFTSESVEGRGLNPFWGWSLLAYFMPWECETGYDPTEVALIKNDHILLD